MTIWPGAEISVPGHFFEKKFFMDLTLGFKEIYLPLSEHEHYRAYHKLYVFEGEFPEGNKLLNEALGSFNNQNLIANEAAKQMASEYSRHQNGISKIDIQGSDIIRCVMIEYMVNGDKTVGQYDSIDADGNIRIKVCMSTFDYYSLTEKEKFNVLYPCIAHELMHGFIVFNRYFNNAEIDDSPYYYDKSIKCYKELGAENIAGAFAYALYSTYYHERQAFVSQTSSFVKSRMEGHDKNDVAFLKSAIKDSASFHGYSNNLETCNKLLDSSELREECMATLNRYGIRYDTDKQFVASVKRTKKLSVDTLKNVFRNAMLAVS